MFKRLALTLTILLCAATADAGRGFNPRYQGPRGYGGYGGYNYYQQPQTVFWYSGVTPWGASYGFVSGGYQPPVYVPMPVYYGPVYYPAWGYRYAW